MSRAGDLPEQDAPDPGGPRPAVGATCWGSSARSSTWRRSRPTGCPPVDGTLTGGGGRTTLGADLAFGQAAGAFGSVGIGVADYDHVNSSAVLVSGTIGTQVQLGTASRTSGGGQLCPVAGIECRNGTNAGDIDQSGLVLRGGVSLGTSIPMSIPVGFDFRGR